MLSKQEEAMAGYLSTEDKVVVQDYVNTNIVGTSNPQTAKQIFASLKDKLSRKDISETSFMGSLSANVRGGYIVGIEGRRRVGYVPSGTAKSSAPKAPKVENAEAAENINNSQKAPVKKQPSSKVVKHSHHVWVGDANGRYTEYRVLRTMGDIEKLVTMVLGGAKNEKGLVVFNGERYSCENTLVLERFMMAFFGGVRTGESEPVLNDGSDVPVELTIQ